MNGELLPIGSVVQIKDSKTLFMIMGYLPVTAGRPGYVWDYSAVAFPFGFSAGMEVTCFDNDQIAVVYAHGYKDIEEEIFMSRLREAKRRTQDQLNDTEKAGSEAPDKEDE